MSDTEIKNSKQQATEEPVDEAFEGAGMGGDLGDDFIDEELLALSPPAPSGQHAIFILIILAFSVMVLWLFWPELRYFLKGFSDPHRLGEAADLEAANLASDSFVQVEGVPLVNRTVTFSTGTKWFSGDIYRKMAPLSGSPNLLVQWHTHNPEIKQAKDALTPPSDFAGRLKRREDLSENYDKFWPFYDCLKLHNTSQCKFCIGKKDLDECRPIFTCVDNYPIEVCDHTAFYTKEEVGEKIEKLEADLSARASADLAADLEANKKALSAFENIDVLSKFVLLEELFDRVGMLEIPEASKDTAFDLQKKIFDIQVAALESRLQKPIEKINSLSGALKSKLLQNQKTFLAGETAVKALTDQKDQLRPLLDIYTELGDFVTLVKEQQDKLRRFSDDSNALKTWKFDGKETGAQLLAKVRDLSALLATLKVDPAPKNEATAKDSSSAEATPTDSPAAKDDKEADQLGDKEATKSADESADESADKTAGENTDVVADETAKKNPKPQENTVAEDAETPSEPALEDPILAAVDAQLDGAVERVAVLGRKLILLAPNEIPELDKWARSTDIVGSLPKPLRADHVFKSYETLLKLVENFEPKQTTSLKSRYKNVMNQLKAERQKVDDLRAASGLAELELVQQFEELQQKTKKAQTPKTLAAAVEAWRNLSGVYAQKEFYPWDLSNYPQVKTALMGLIKKADVSGLEAEVAALEQQYAPSMYVLLDNEKPTDNPWILFVYLVVPIMLVINFRKLLRFIADWRQ